ncbi:MAG TPA: biotin--[acetyl-CoA-carboxylase] ligase [Gemmatimonadales bacterium]|nr:biotin--[acetyl-CoA-carboxylase] ligase [Gemmatimonadales bacterium]
MTAHDAPVHYFDRVASTQDIAHRLASEGAPSGTAVVAVEQTAGRGSRGREWSSGRGGLWVSVLWRPAEAANPETLSLRASLSLAAALEAAGCPALGIKWPNDLMLGNRKAGGILCEARWSGDTLSWVVAGAGVNVTNDIPESLAHAACTVQPGRGELRVNDLLLPAIAALRAAGARRGPLAPDELAEFARRDWLRGRMLTAPINGCAQGIAADGALLVRRPDGTLAVARAGTVAAIATPLQP